MNEKLNTLRFYFLSCQDFSLHYFPSLAKLIKQENRFCRRQNEGNILAGVVMVLATKYTIKGAIKIHEDRKTLFQPTSHVFLAAIDIILLKYHMYIYICI